MIKIDDRTPEQKKTHNWLVTARDKFMTGWGLARNGASFCAWAYESLEAAEMGEKWVNSRSDMQYVNICQADKYRPSRSCAHFHIYVADSNHPSLNQ